MSVATDSRDFRRGYITPTGCISHHGPKWRVYHFKLFQDAVDFTVYWGKQVRPAPIRFTDEAYADYWIVSL